jgi:hypothetical protein
LFGSAFVSVFGMRHAFFGEIEGFRGVEVFSLLLFSLSKSFCAVEVLVGSLAGFEQRKISAPV